MPPTGERGGQRKGTRGDTYAEESEVGADLHGDTGELAYWAPRRMCAFNVSAVDIGAKSYDGRN